jgi:predicted ribosome quality control (RQC) complex YloA/Tae2 family protein
MTPTLNWLELSALIEKIKPEIKELFVDRIIIPERLRFPEGYLKGEWSIRLTSRKQEVHLNFSIRPRHPYLGFWSGKGHKASTQATHSPFDLSLSKHLKGARLLDIEALNQERIAILWFTGSASDQDEKLGLVLFLIPAVPEAFLVSAKNNSNDPNEWKILSRSRTVRQHDQNSEVFKLPSGSKAPTQLTTRENWVHSAEALYPILESELNREAFALRVQNAEKAIRALAKQAKDRLRQSDTARAEAEKEENWKEWADLLKANLGNPPELQKGFRSVTRFEDDQRVEIPCDPKLSIQEQVEKFYSNSRRKLRRILEAKSRSETFRESLSRLEKLLAHPPEFDNWTGLEKLERASNNRAPETKGAKQEKTGKKTGAAWLGKSFTSSNGLPIWVGRDKTENLELTFKCARGNDLWMHIRGKPGAHVVIPLQSGKSAPLDTLLDAAHLAIHYSGGGNWGKTEVDYTFKKYVKRIKDSTEASYTNNKTLLINPDRGRIKKLLDQAQA